MDCPYQIILVRPAIPENVGMVARCMKAFGFERLNLISPAFEWNDSCAAYKTACGSQDVLRSACVYHHLKEALSSCTQVVGFSRRSHDFDRPFLEVSSWIEQLDLTPKNTRIALVFGPEDCGLTNEDKHSCHWLVSIPTPSKTLSLNLAQAVTVVLYSLASRKELAQSLSRSQESAATHADLHRIVERLVHIVEPTSFFKAGRRHRQVETIRHLVFRWQLSDSEYDTVMGILTALEKRTTPQKHK